jgi:hypothetical protein
MVDFQLSGDHTSDVGNNALAARRVQHPGIGSRLGGFDGD